MNECIPLSSEYLNLSHSLVINKKKKYCSNRKLQRLRHKCRVNGMDNQALQAATTGSLLFNIRVEYSVFVIAFGL